MAASAISGDIFFSKNVYSVDSASSVGVVSIASAGVGVGVVVGSIVYSVDSASSVGVIFIESVWVGVGVGVGAEVGVVSMASLLESISIAGMGAPLLDLTVRSVWRSSGTSRFHSSRTLPPRLVWPALLRRVCMAMPSL